MSPQTARVLAALRSRGARGVTRVDFQAPDVIDNGSPILNFPARIYELKHEHGHTIVKEGIRHSCTIYRLLHDAQDGPEPSRAPAREPGPAGLFTPAPRLAIFDEDIEAA